MERRLVPFTWLVTLAAALAIAAAPPATAVAAPPLASSQVSRTNSGRLEAQAMPPLPPLRRALVGVKGTPHTWFADEQGILHWVGDSAALLKGLYAGREYDLADPLDDALKNSLRKPAQLTFEQLRASRRGEPWLSTRFVAMDGAIYHVAWEAFREQPALLRVQSPEDLELFGVTPGNHSAYVLGKEAWEQQFGVPLDSLEQDVLRPAVPPLPTPPPCLPAVQELVVQARVVAAKVHNPCGATLRFGLSAVIYDMEGGQPLATTTTATWEATAGETRDVALRGGSSQGTWAMPLRNAAPENARPGPLCLPVGAGACLHTDPWLRQAVEVLQGLEVARPLLETAADFGVALRRGELPEALGLYDPVTRTITIGDFLDRYSDWERAVVLAHELQHASDHAAGALLLTLERTQANCLAREEDAFRRGAQVWHELWQSNLPEPRDPFQEYLNETTHDALYDPERLSQDIARSYDLHCRR